MGWWNLVQVRLIRVLARVNTLIDLWFISPRPYKPSFTVNVPSKLSTRSGNFTLYFYTRPEHKQEADPQRHTSGGRGRPLIVNFHGGGFSLGHATDDARWASTLLRKVDAVFVSVGYRKGPECPQPTAVTDGVDALRWLWEHASEYGFEPSRTIVTGFSAGGNLSLTVPLRHYADRKVDERPDAGAHDGSLAGIISFYPSVNQTLTRQFKADSNPISKTKGSIGPRLYKLMDDAYYGSLPPSGRGSIDLSPALASREMLLNALPSKMAIFTCEWDQLLREAEDFRAELKALGKTVGGTIARGLPHGFDKLAGKHPQARDIMYQEAVEQIQAML